MSRLPAMGSGTPPGLSRHLAPVAHAEALATYIQNVWHRAGYKRVRVWAGPRKTKWRDQYGSICSTTIIEVHSNLRNGLPPR